MNIRVKDLTTEEFINWLNSNNSNSGFKYICIINGESPIINVTGNLLTSEELKEHFGRITIPFTNESMLEDKLYELLKLIFKIYKKDFNKFYPDFSKAKNTLKCIKGTKNVFGIDARSQLNKLHKMALESKGKYTLTFDGTTNTFTTIIKNKRNKTLYHGPMEDGIFWSVANGLNSICENK